MKFPQLLLMFWSFSIFTVSDCITVDGSSCVSSYWDTVSCVLNITFNPTDQTNSHSSYSLKFTEIWNEMNESDQTFTCPLTLNSHSHICVCKVTDDEEMAAYNNFTIQVCDDAGCQCLRESFTPSQNIQLTAPHQVQVHQTPEVFNISWQSGYEDHIFADILVYELLLLRSQSSWSKTLSLTEKFGSIPRLKLEAIYCTKVRSKTSESRYYKYHGTWSEWSQQTCWENDMKEVFSEQEHILVTLTKYLGPVCVVIGVVLFVFYSPTTRMKIKTLSHTPSPAPFFQPLYQQHDGNLQEWLGPRATFALTFSPDEILIAEALTVAHKPITKDAEENQDLTFSQSQSSYVGVPGAFFCPGEAPYTQLPCSVWGFAAEDVQEKSSPPDDFLDTSHEDSGCSCKDVTPSPESSSPNSPMDERPPPCFSADYCVLNKTAAGVVPVLVK